MTALLRACAALWLIAGSAAAAPAPATLQADLSAQFPDPALRDQGRTGACHVFTSVSLVEAALFRRFALRLALSESDLFVRRVIEDPAYYSDVEAAVRQSTGAALAYRFIEGGWPQSDIAFVLKSGVAKAVTAPWAAFAGRYYAFKTAQQRAIAEKKDARFDRTVAIPHEMRREAASDAADRRLDNMGQERGKALQRAVPQADAAASAAKAGFMDFLRQTQGKTQAEAEKTLLGDDPQLAKDRALVKTLTAGFKLQIQKFAAVSGSALGEACRRSGLPVKAAVLARLRKNVPVSVSMDIGSIPGWGDVPSGSWNAFTVVGFETDRAGSVTLRSRNSWGGDNPDILEAHLCRIDGLISVLTPAE